MTELPAALAPWAPQLEIFPREIATALGPLVRRLAAAIGPWRSLPSGGLTEPDGFAGVGRRGHYERLLTTEWLLAEEAPLEFWRRATEGEHSFLQLARRDPAESGFCGVLCDAGPNQLGSPRLVQLAALIVLARRAQLGGAEFGWGVLQREDELYSEVTAGTINHFLNARGVPETTEGQVLRWKSSLELRVQDSHRAEFWLLGGHRLQRACSDESLLLICDPLEAGERCVEATILATPGAPPAQIRLPLPEESLCARMLRDPFATATARPTASIPRAAAGMLFTVGGSKLVIRGEGGTLLSLSVPGHPRPEKSKPRIHSVGAGTDREHKFVPVAAGRHGAFLHIVALSAAGQGKIIFIGGSKHQPARFFDWEMPEGLAEKFPWTGHLGACVPLADDPDCHAALLPGEHLVVLAPDGEKAAQVLWQQNNVFALTHNEGMPLYAMEVGPGEAVRRRFGRAGTKESWRLQGGNGSKCLGAVTGFAGRFSQRGGLWAVQDENGWSIPTTPRALLVQPLPEGSRVVGVLDCGSREEPGLVVIGPKGQIAICGEASPQRVPVPASVDCVVSPSASVLAYRTSSGEIGVYSLALEKQLLRLLPEDIT